MDVRVVSFAELDGPTAYAVWRLRQDVFVVEQNCPYPDLDGRDTEPGARHVVLTVEGRVAGTARLLHEDSGVVRVGRVALAKSARGQGLADQLMHAALAEIAGRPSVLDAQAPLAGWYAGFGYGVAGDEFLEDGIPHVPMERPGQPR